MSPQQGLFGGEASRGGAWVCPLTAPGRGAIAVIRVWGPRAVEVADAVFRPRRGTRRVRTARGRLRLGRIGHGLGDEVVTVVLEGDPPAVEVQCHGGPAATSLVLEALQAAGALLTDITGLAEHLSDDPFTRDAFVDLARAATIRVAEILLDQSHGALRNDLTRLWRSIADDPGRSLMDLDSLIARGDVGVRLLGGWKVVIAGRPNVGKSRLFNALVGFTRAIVDPAPGTTRDVVSVRAAFHGWPVELADTAGLRESDDLVECIGIERSRREHQQADLVLVVLDRSIPFEEIDSELINSNCPAILVGNKSDLPAAWHAGELSFRSAPVVMVSAHTGDGMDRLIELIGSTLVPHPPPAGAGVPFRIEHVDRLVRIRGHVSSGDRSRAMDLLEEIIDRPTRGDQ